MEIERKYLINFLPEKYEQFPNKDFIQAYLNISPVIRIRKEDNDYFLTYKGKGTICREEYNLPIDKISFNNLITKCDGNIIKKRRYFIPIEFSSKNMSKYNCTSTSSNSAVNLTAELDIFEGIFSGLITVEVEFNSLKEADAFNPPKWFGKDISEDMKYKNSSMSLLSCNPRDLIIKTD